MILYGIRTRLLDRIRDHFPGDVGETFVASAVADREAFVIHAEEMQDRGVEVVHADFILHGVQAEIVGLADRCSALGSATGEPHREAERVVIPAFAAYARTPCSQPPTYL